VHLKALTIKGFKSFAEPVTMRFEPGVTVVVGPNGSGKSNVVDAVAWVLGAQGPRTFRSQRMEDVIFAGSAGRPPLGRAEVSLTLDNGDGKVPGGMAEITIQRTLFRSGESEYALNGRPCRLLDIQELLSDAGVGRQQHVIVSQGQLDHVLQARPEERRAILEEAAGVLKHRRRRERAERRLAATQENLDRLADVVREVKRQLRPLERQASAARRHASLSRERDLLASFLRRAELAHLEERRRQLADEGRVLQREELDVRDELAQVEEALSSATGEVAGEEVEALVARASWLDGLVERALGCRRRLEERQARVAEALADRREDQALADLAVQLDEGQRELAELTEALGRAQAALADAQAAQAAAEEAAAQAGTVDGDLAALRGTQARHAEALATRQHRQRALQREEAALAGAEQRVREADERLAQLAAEEAALEGEVHELHERLQAAQATERTAQGALREAEEALAVAQGALREVEGQRHRREAEAEALEKAAAQARGAAGLDLVLGLPGVLGLLGDLVEVEAGWREAFEAAVGPAVAAIVVQGPSEAQAVLGRLTASTQGGSVLFPSTGRTPGPERSPAAAPPIAGAEALSTRVRARQPALADLVDELLAGVWAVQGDWTRAVQVALSRPDLVLVTTDGARFGRGGWRVGGPAIVTGLAVEEAREQAAEAGALARQAAAQLDAAEQRAQAAKAAAQEAADSLRAAERAASERRAQLERLQQRRTDLSAESTRARAALEEARRRAASEREALEQVEAALPGLAQAAQEAATALDQAERTREELEGRRRHAAEERRRCEVAMAGLQERHKAALRRVAELGAQRDRLAEQAQVALARRARAEAEGRILEQLGARLDPVLADAVAQRDQVRAARDARLAAQRALANRLEQLQGQRSELGQRLEALRERRQRCEVELAELGVRRDQLLAELALEGSPAEEAPTSAEELRETLGLEPTADLAGRLQQVEAELARLGPVNPLALEELAALEERAGQLDEQMADIQAAKRELQTVIRQVDDEVARLFGETFLDVDRHFQQLVATLFPGGSGRLVLTDPEDPLGTGVEVEARPAGKQVKRLSLLSGGERSLVALAFLFAVARSRPSPFYLMDEVEAALDDVNLHRFLGLVQQFRQEAQLIIVSHQKRTMEAADALYGVTMHAGGYSKVVSQRIERHHPTSNPLDHDPDPTGVSVGS
jgi:chromosome segregation protein